MEDPFGARAGVFWTHTDSKQGEISYIPTIAPPSRVLASLNHPNIAAIHGVEEIDTCHLLVMELVPGETLAERIKR